MKVLIAHPGTQYSHQLAYQLNRNGVLCSLHTCFAFSSGGTLDKAIRCIPERLARRFDNRRIDGVPAKRVRCHICIELKAICRLRSGGGREDSLHLRNRDFQLAIPNGAFGALDAVIGFDTSSWILAQRSISASVPFFLDRSIGHSAAKEAVYSEIRARYPGWSETIPKKSAEELYCENVEHSLAHTIVVPSSFAKDSLIQAGIRADRIAIVPFGTHLNVFYPATHAPPRPVKFLFAGSFTARKGLPVLLDAWKEAELGEHAELWLVGGHQLPDGVQLPPSVHTFGSLTRQRLATLMQQAHVFVFPSFFEGLAQVQIEALATGLPVIGTYASGATDIVDPGNTGVIIPAGNTSTLAEALVRFVANRHELSRMRDNCISHRERLCWSIYGDRWMQLLLKTTQSRT